MPFNIGSVFSPEMLRMVDAESNRRQDSNERRLALQASLYRGHQDDKFRQKQLNATMSDQNADRSSRERMAADATDSRQQLNEANLNYKSALLGERTRGADDMLSEKKRQFDEMFPIQQQRGNAAETRAGASETNAGARRDQVGLNREIQFGSGDADNPGAGSAASGRRAMEGKTVAQTDSIKKQAEVITQKLVLATDNMADQKRRTDILAAAQDLHERTFKVKSAHDAEALAIDLVKTLRNPLTGAYNDAEVARVSSMLSGQIFGAMENFNAKYAQAFADQFQKSAQEGLNSDVDASALKNRAAHASEKPTSIGDERAKKAQEVLRAIRESTRSNMTGQPPNQVGR